MRPTRRLIYLELEKHGTRSIVQLEETLNVGRKNIGIHLNELHNDRMAYIKDYAKPPRGGFVPLWALGDKNHKPAPKPLAPGLKLASDRASKNAHKAKALREKAEALRVKALELEQRAQEFIEENQRIKLLTRGHVGKPTAPNIQKASPWATLIR